MPFLDPANYRKPLILLSTNGRSDSKLSSAPSVSISMACLRVARGLLSYHQDFRNGFVKTAARSSIDIQAEHA